MRTDRRPAASIAAAPVFLVGAGTLAYEVLLIRRLSLVQWHHLTPQLVSLALLGVGVSGLCVALLRRRIERRPREWFSVLAAGFSLTALSAHLVADRMGFNALELAWSLRPALAWGGAALVLAVPFTLGGAAVAVALLTGGDRTARLYGADLAGAACGAGAGLAVLAPAGLERSLELAALAPAAAALAARPRGASALSLGALALALCAIGLPASWKAPRLPDFKAEARALAVLGARGTRIGDGLLGRLSTVENDTVPLRHAPGLSPLSPVAPPPQVALFRDAESLGVIPGRAARRDRRFAAWQVSAAPYALLEAPAVLVLDAGGGEALAQALALGARAVDAVEPDARIVELVRGRYRAFSGDLYRDPRVEVHSGAARAFVARTPRRYDLVVLPRGGDADAGIESLRALRADARWTVEALATVLRRLRPGGMMVIERWLMLPPRADARLLATLAAALRRVGARDPRSHVVWVHGILVSALLVSRDPFGAPALRRIARWCETRGFEVVHGRPGPGPASETAALRVLAERLLGGGATPAAFPYRTDPVTDDRPYPWSTFPLYSVLGAAPRTARAPHPAIGDLVHLLALAQAVVLGLALVGAAAWFGRDRPRRHPPPAGAGPPAPRVAGFGAAVGAGFMLAEMVALEWVAAVAARPVLGVAAVLAVMLAGAGLGASASTRLSFTAGRPGAVALGIAFALAGSALAVRAAMGEAFALPDGVRTVAVAAALAPLAFALGMPMALVLAALAGRRPGAIPLAWAANGCASVVAALAAPLIAAHAGYRATLLAAAAAYLVAGLLGESPGTGQPPPGRRRRAPLTVRRAIDDTRADLDRAARGDPSSEPCIESSDAISNASHSRAIWPRSSICTRATTSACCAWRRSSTTSPGRPCRASRER